jgi:hypothetical protein
MQIVKNNRDFVLAISASLTADGKELPFLEFAFITQELQQQQDPGRKCTLRQLP